MLYKTVLAQRPNMYLWAVHTLPHSPFPLLLPTAVVYFMGIPTEAANSAFSLRLQEIEILFQLWLFEIRFWQNLL